MTDTKIHLCDTCGGRLLIDKERAMYMCPFCGITYDYAYFNEDDILEKAAGFMSNREFEAARDAYEFLLKKNPHDLDALTGLIMIKCGISKLSELKDTKVLESFTGDPAFCDSFIESENGETKDRLLKVRDILGQAKEYKDSNDKILALYEEKTSEEDKIEQCESAKTVHYYTRNNDALGITDHLHPMKTFKKTALYLGGIFGSNAVICLIVCLLSPRDARYGVPVFFVAVPALTLAGMYFYSVRPRMQRINNYQKQIDRHKETISLIDEQIKELTDRKNTCSRNIKKIMDNMSENKKE